MKYERMKLRHALFAADAKFKKNKKYKEPESDLDDDAIATHEDNLKAKEIEKAEKKFQKDNEKAAAEQQAALKAEADAVEAALEKEHKSDDAAQLTHDTKDQQAVAEEVKQKEAALAAAEAATKKVRPFTSLIFNVLHLFLSG